MITHGVAFAPAGYDHGQPGCAAFAHLRSYAGPYTGADATDTQAFSDGSTIVTVGTGAERRVFPWPLVGNGPIEPLDIARLNAVLPTLHPGHLWWTDHSDSSFRATTPVKRDDLFGNILTYLAGHDMDVSRVTLRLTGGTISAPGWPAQDPKLTILLHSRYGLKSEQDAAPHARQEADALATRLSPLLWPGPDLAIFRRWVFDYTGAIGRLTPTVFEMAASLDGKPNRHETLAARAKIERVLSTTV